MVAGGPAGLTPSPILDLNDGNRMPQLGLGLMRFGAEDETQEVLGRAVEVGYRMFDTAAVYGTERQAGEGLRSTGLDRGDAFVTTKLWNSAHARGEVREAFEKSVSLLDLGPLDLYLIHWPIPAEDRYVDAWKVLIELQREGRVASIGVSNFEREHLERLIAETGVAPAVNQVELHPWFQQRPLRQFHDEHGIVTQAWSPFGGGGMGKTGSLLDAPTIVDIADRHGCHPCQVVLAWHLANGLAVIPKATSAEHLAQNLSAVEVVLDDDDLAALDGLDRADGRLGPEPAAMKLTRDLG